MHYMGGKTRSAREICSTIVERGGGTFVSLFCGALSVECAVSESGAFERVIANDIHPYLIAMFRALQNGWMPPTEVSLEQYRYVRDHKDEDPALTGFVGFGCSYGGKWFGGFARGKSENYANEAHNSLMRQLPHIKQMEFLRGDYRSVFIPDGATVYADPPYAGTTGYHGTGKFDGEAFWDYMRTLAKRGCRVFVSEQNAPEDFRCVWEKPVKRWIGNSDDNVFVVTERQYTL